MITTVYIAPGFGDDPSQARIYAKNGLILKVRDDYARNPGTWAEIGLMNHAGHIVCLSAPLEVYEELYDSEPLMAGSVWTFPQF